MLIQDLPLPFLLIWLTWHFFITSINHLTHFLTYLCLASALPLALPLAFFSPCHLSCVFSWQVCSLCVWFCSCMTACIIILFTTWLVFLFYVTLWQSLPAYPGGLLLVFHLTCFLSCLIYSSEAFTSSCISLHLLPCLIPSCFGICITL